MIRVKAYNEICKQIVQVTGIDGYILSSTEEQGTRKLKDAAGVQLVAVYPSYGFEGDEDSYKSTHEMLFFMITRQRDGQSEESELEQYASTQDAMIKLKEFLFGENSSYCKLFPNVDASTVTIDPEYNIFGGYIGWSIKLVC